jgi:hypothetical protein
VEAYLIPYNRKGLHSPTCPLYVRGEVKGGASGPCTKCLHPVATTDWSLFSPAPSASCADRCAPGQHTSSAASYTTGTCACARQQQAIRDRGNFGVFSASKRHHVFTFVYVVYFIYNLKHHTYDSRLVSF